MSKFTHFKRNNSKNKDANCTSSPKPIYSSLFLNGGKEIIYPSYFKGATGATGPAGGGEIIAGQTFTIDSGKDARVTTTYMGDKTYLNFYIPKGNNGNSEKVKTGFVITAQPYEDAMVEDRYLDGVHYLDFIIPRGEKGDTGERGEAGAQGERGFTGEKGEKGDTGERGEKGEQGARGLQGEVGPQGAKGDRGEKGDTGPIGPTGVVETEGAMIVSYVDPLSYTVDGEEIQSNGRLPLKRLELDYGGVVTLNENASTIKFTKTGVYKFTFSINAYTSKSGGDFSHETDFVAVSLRGVESDNIYGGVNGWTDREVASNMFGQGMLTVADTSIEYELVNVQKKSLFLVGANISQTVSNSYFAVPMVSLVITRI